MLFFTEQEQEKIRLCMGKSGHKRLWIVKEFWERKMKLEESTFWTSEYTTKVQTSRQCGTCTETEM